MNLARLRRNLQQRVGVAPHELLEHLGRRQPLDQPERLTRDALAGHARGRRVVALAHAAAVAVAAAAIAAEDQLVLVARQEMMSSFFDDVIHNRAAPVRVFTDPDAAATWLRENG